MSSAGQERVGAASGINNAVSRVAGVLAIAVLGIVMVKAFAFRLEQRVSSLPSNVVREIKGQENKLAGLSAPAGLDTPARVAVKESVGAAFVFGFRVVMGICAGLSVMSAVVAWVTISAAR
jgi:hypothetical protein